MGASSPSKQYTLKCPLLCPSQLSPDRHSRQTVIAELAALAGIAVVRDRADLGAIVIGITQIERELIGRRHRQARVQRFGKDLAVTVGCGDDLTAGVEDRVK